MRVHGLTLAVSLAVAACAKEPSPATATTAAAQPAAAPLKVLTTPEVSVGSAPPDFTATAHDGTAVHLAALSGHPVVVYFYPKDETPGCTKEACSFRDAWTDLQKPEKGGVVLIGVSGDTDASHRAFAEHHKLPFLLVSDPEGALAKAYGVPFRLGYAGRQSFVVGADGKVKKVYRDVDVGEHARQIAADVAP